MNQRPSGILLHPTSLSNTYPVGDLGDTTLRFPKADPTPQTVTQEMLMQATP